MQYSVPAVEIQRVFRFWFRRLSKPFACLWAAGLALSGLTYWLLGGELGGLFLLGIWFSVLFAAMQLLVFLASRNLILVVRCTVTLSLILTTIAASHIIDFNPVLGILIIAALTVLHTLASFAAAHWFTHGRLAYTVDGKGIKLRLEYGGKDVLLRMLTIKEAFTPWKHIKGMHADIRTKTVGFDQALFREGVFFVLLPDNPEPVLRILKRGIPRHRAYL